MRAFVLIREVPACRRDAFCAGLQTLGYSIHRELPAQCSPGDVVVLWNGNFITYEDRVIRARAQGAVLLVAENGYIGRQANGQQLYALARDGHNGAGSWPPNGQEDRWAGLGIDLKPWRASGSHVVICAQRGIGSRSMANPPNWHHRMAVHLRAITRRKVIIREHGGKPAFHARSTEDMQQQLQGAHAVVIWSSANGVRALVEGVPVIYSAPHWICRSAASSNIGAIDDPPMPDRLPALRRMAWAQWTVEEIASGVPLQRLIDLKRAAT